MSVRQEEMARRLGVDRECPEGADTVSRRGFVKLLGASIALAGLDGCTRMPASNILPYADQPELTPGIPQYYATSMVLDGFATGLLVESHEGRPTKVEGNPDHPASLGAAGVYEQASVLQLYDPHRAGRVRHRLGTSSWKELAAVLAPSTLRARVGAGGAGLFLLLEPTSSPLDSELLDRLIGMYPAAGVHFYSPFARLNDSLLPQYDVSEADVIVAVDADFLATGPFHLRYARDFAARRRPEASRGMNRLYAIEPSVTVTGTAADHRIAVRPGEIVPALEVLLAAIRGTPGQRSGPGPDWVAPIARDLRAHGDRSLIVAGPYLPERARALAHQINLALGNIGRTIWFSRSPLLGAGDERHSLARLVDALRAGHVDTLICVGGNPSYATPGALGVASLIRRVPQTVYLGLYENETARDCQWMVPAAHFLESWSDARAYDGTLSIVQPLIEPLAGGKTSAELLSLLLGMPDAHPYDLLRQAWRGRGNFGDGSDFEDGWRKILGRGVVEGSSFPREQAGSAALTPDAQRQRSLPIEILFRPDARVRDGAFANNGWLQELPDPVTTLTWGNAAHLSPATAQRFGAVTGDLLDIQSAGLTVRIPALVMPGHADDTVTVHFGYGRDGSEALARGVGVDVYPLWPDGAFTAGASVTRMPSASHRTLAITQPHHTLDASKPARAMTLDEYSRLGPRKPSRSLTLYEPQASLPDGPARQQWAMTIDLGACIGCGACMVACQAENNVPVVGHDDVVRGREMHWLRIDWYAARSGEPATIAQPMLCQQCEKAPCEYVCPVEATVHSSDGLNEMVYNRCVGTRFCSNNCPYKVRRFNWFDYSAGLSPIEGLVKNPDVTVRERGVMEKCTFCVQRIRQAEIAARLDGRRPVREGEIQTACQQTCPTRAIVFGSLTEKDGQVARDRRNPRAYAALEDLGTEPRVLYLARVRNSASEGDRRK
ncbi:MAG TPA: 4Fe-4S dicluster domain-containing protein [Vicinamibacterales bacterium]|nr:4Fe-4S dicluster domain-containing protein [Vicinamibacterales bacterium]